MSTGFIEIYNRAMSKFDDPILSKIYRENNQEFFRIFYLKIQSAISDFSIPSQSVAKLDTAVDPVFYTEVFDGDGLIKTFTLTEDILSGLYFIQAIVDDEVVNIDLISGKNVSLHNIPPAGVENVIINVYIDGYFSTTINNDEKEILSLFLVKEWAGKENNFLPDIRRLVSDKDFKLISEANSLKEKSNWYTMLREEAEKKMNAYSWQLSFAERRRR
jgi:hypothetical protein